VRRSSIVRHDQGAHGSDALPDEALRKYAIPKSVHDLWIGSIHGTFSGFSTGSISRFTTTVSLSLRIDPRTVDKMVEFSPARPKLGPFIAVIDKILADDTGRPKKQQHTAKRIFERLRDEHGFTGGVTIVKDYVAGWRQRSQEMFVPLVHPPGHAQVDFGEAIGIIGGSNARFTSSHSICRTRTLASSSPIRLRRPRPSATATCGRSHFLAACRSRFCMTLLEHLISVID